MTDFVFFVGIDVFKDSFFVSIKNSSSQTIFSKSFSQSFERFNQFHSTLHSLNQPVLIAMESTSLLHSKTKSLSFFSSFSLNLKNLTSMSFSLVCFYLNSLLLIMLKLLISFLYKNILLKSLIEKNKFFFR